MVAGTWRPSPSPAAGTCYDGSSIVVTKVIQGPKERLARASRQPQGARHTPVTPPHSPAPLELTL